MAQEETASSRIFSFHVENDVFAKTDYHYTSGLKLNWLFMEIPENKEKNLFSKWYSRLFNHLPFTNQAEYQYAVSLSIGQNIYTPEDITSSDLIVDDRPYVGVTYLGIGFHSIDHRSLTTWDLQIGIVGPHSSAEQCQTIFHRWMGNTIPKGWHNQLHDEPILNIGCEHKWKILHAKEIGPFEFDLIPNVGAALGNLITYNHIGSEFRFGWGIPADYGAFPLHYEGGQLEMTHKQDSRYSMYFFGSIDGIFVLRNILLDGNTFRESHHVEKMPFVLDIVAGVKMMADQFQLSCAWVYRSKTFRIQRKGQLFGSITLSVFR
jgi:hypothetical protein